MRKNRLFENTTVGVITINELQQSFPALAVSYKQIFAGKRPTIKVVSTDHFSGSGGGQGSRETAVFFKNGQTKSIQGSWGGANPWAASSANALDLSSTIELHDGEAVMSCISGSYNVCMLYIHPSLVNSQMLGPSEASSSLDMFEVATLTAFVGLIPAARKKEFFEFMQGSFGSFELERAFKTKPTKEEKVKLFKDKYAPEGVSTYEQLWGKILQNLAAKGLMKITANGSAQLTMEGKNVASRMKGPY